ncbi:hypothetical protein X765_32150 [Mesorhizobium sp. LSHC440B00]|nr:hypothetical protein X765_32150 [Mesorhizobium sp. LSHC440B00]ESX29155.1 hypothetical protein X764_31960 [Mesorhizobium sp. LSHC440A00]
MEQVIQPEVPERCEGLGRLLIGEDVSERLDVTPARFRVIVTRRPKYAYRNRDGGFQAPAPAHIVESGIPTERLLAQIAVSKYADGLPLYRQEAIYARDKVELSRSLMTQWMGKVGFELQPLADHILERIKQGERVFPDETTLPTSAPGTGKPGYGPTRATTGHSAASARPWSPIASRTVGAVTASRATWRASPASCRSTETHATRQGKSKSQRGRPSRGLLGSLGPPF